MDRFLRQLFSFFGWQTKKRIACVFTCMLGGALLEMVGIALIVPMLAAVLDPTDDRLVRWTQGVPFLPNAREPLLLSLAAGLFMFFALKNLALAAIIYLQNRVVNLEQAACTERLFFAYLDRPYVDHMAQNSAEALRNITWSVSILFGNGLLAFLTFSLEAMLVVGAGAVLVIVEPAGTAVAVGILGLSMGLLYLATRHRLADWGSHNKRDGTRIIQIVSEAMAAFKEIRILGRAPGFIALFRGPNASAADLRTKLNVVGQMPRLVGEIVILGAILAVVIVLAALRGDELAASLPVLGAFAAASLRIGPSINRLVASANLMRQSVKIIDDLHRDYYAVAHRPGAGMGGKVEFRRSLSVEALSYHYPGADRRAIDSVSFSIDHGTTVALVGASGAGKSTLADLLLGLLTPETGTVRVDGVDIAGDLRAWQGCIGYVPQTITILDADVRANIAFGIEPALVDDAKVWAAAHTAQVADVIRSLPQGLDTRLGERGIRLSGGQRQRIGIARALFRDPEFLVLDEATSALDNLTEQDFTRALDALHGIKTVVVIAHRVATFRRCDRLLFLDTGRLMDCGSFEDLARRNATFRRIVLTDEHVSTVTECTHSGPQSAHGR